ncbi:hypothetical protein ACFLRM_02075 [Acidobacteriota bacterium]
MFVGNNREPEKQDIINGKGVNIENKKGIHELLVSYYAADRWTPLVSKTEALKLEAENFFACIENNKTPINDGYAGLKGEKIIEASDLF